MFGTQKKEEIDSLAHTHWNCKYHIVFAPKYRRQAIYGQIRADIGSILRKLCEYKGVEIIEAETCPDHIHMLVSIPPKYSVSQFMGYLKGKSSLMIFDRHANLKVQVRKPAVLVQGLLRGYSREEQESNCGVYPKSACRRQNIGSDID